MSNGLSVLHLATTWFFAELTHEAPDEEINLPPGSCTWERSTRTSCPNSMLQATAYEHIDLTYPRNEDNLIHDNNGKRIISLVSVN